MFWPVPYYSSFVVCDYVVPVCRSRARWLDFLPPADENWFEVDVNDLDSETLYGAFCELQTMHKRGRHIRDFRKKEELLITWLRKRGYDVNEDTFEMVQISKSKSRRYLNDFPAIWKKWDRSLVQDQDKEVLQGLLEELYERSDYDDEWQQSVDVIVEELEDQGWLWDEETKELEKIKKKGRKFLTDYSENDKGKGKNRSNREVALRSRSHAPDDDRSDHREHRTY